MRTQLLCTFSNKRDYESDLVKVVSNYDILFDKVYILQNIDSPFQLYLTYNIDSSHRQEILSKTISVHRKKNTNTLYTINALNELVMKETGGVIDSNHEITWEDYQNTLILTGEDEVKIIETKLFKIIDI